jgi:hypothetical protein
MKVAVMASLLAKRNVDVYSPSQPPQREGDKTGNIF